MPKTFGDFRKERKMATKPKTISERAVEARDAAAHGNGGNGNNLPVPMQNAEPPAELLELADQQTGQGVSFAGEDRLVPLIYVLHYQSPQVMRDEPQYIEGAEPGDFWLRNAPPGYEIAKGSDGMIVQSCYFYKDVGEWLPRSDGGSGGQGFKGRHPYDRPEQVPGARRHPDGNPFHWTTANGMHDLIETRNHALLVYHYDRVFPYLFPFTSTRHLSSREWMNLIAEQIIQSGPYKGKVWNSCARFYRLTTYPKKNEKGRWHLVKAEVGPWCNREQYDAGNKLAMQFESGERVAAEPESVIDNEVVDNRQENRSAEHRHDDGDPGPQQGPF